jgi:hypothetical protein
MSESINQYEEAQVMNEPIKQYEDDQFVSESIKQYDLKVLSDLRPVERIFQRPFLGFIMMKMIIYFTVLALLEEQGHSTLLNGLILNMFTQEVIKKGLDSQRKFINMSHYL